MALDNDKNRRSGRKFEEIPDNDNAPAAAPAGSDDNAPAATPVTLTPTPSSEGVGTGVVAAVVPPSAFPAKAGAKATGESQYINLSDLGVAELIEWRGKIDRLLPPRTLADVNLEAALLEQYHVANELMTTTLASGEEANKKAQTVNTCTAILQSVVKMQTELYNAERVKALELAIDRAFKKTLPEKKKEFFEAYARAIDEVRAQYMTKAQRRDQGT